MRKWGHIPGHRLADGRRTSFASSMPAPEPRRAESANTFPIDAFAEGSAVSGRHLLLDLSDSGERCCQGSGRAYPEVNEAAWAWRGGDAGSTGSGRRGDSACRGGDIGLRARVPRTLPRLEGRRAEAVGLVELSRQEVFPRLALRAFRQAAHGRSHSGGDCVELRAGGKTGPGVPARARRTVHDECTPEGKRHRESPA